MAPTAGPIRETVLWAKTSKDNPHTFHPVICHMIDVASVAQVLWDRVMPSTLRDRVTRGLGLDTPKHAGAWVSYLAGLHDIGKASPGFQAKNEHGWARVCSAGYSAPIEPRDVGHGTVSALALREILTEPGHGALPPKMVTRFIAAAIGGHHGVFPNAADISRADVADVRGASDWAVVRRNLANELASQTGIHEYPCPTTIDAATATIIAGLTSVADWIGSDERYFPFAARSSEPPALDINAYMRQASNAAARALGELGWLDWAPSTERLDFTDLFDHIKDPRPVQRSIIELSHLTEAPGIVIIEVPMGEGKTEAAFYLADQWISAIGQNGCYVAMPTMATSNQMFGRLREFLTGRYPDATLNLQLLHSQAALEVDLEAMAQEDDLPVQPSEDEDGPHQTSGQALVREWFTRRKRGLLAPFGVGTVDQSLLAILRTPHHFVRLFGLAGKTVIFDEVHAYDIYMTTLFERLMTWLGALGASVVVLSATLPDQRRRQLLAAYADGAGIKNEVTGGTAQYPRISWVNTLGDGAALEVETSDAIRRTLGIGWIHTENSPEDSWSGLAGWIADMLTHGGCAAIICNTVRQAREIYQVLQPVFPGMADDGEPGLDLLHSRFPYEERQQREKRALRRFGKPGGVVIDEDGSEVPIQRPKRAVLVSTQIIEQSLDLDFDLMVSEVAPVDLLLQRSGRLHRHQRESRPPGLEQPTLWLRPPHVPDGVPTFQGGTPVIYDQHVLFRSWLILNERGTVAIPEDIGPLIEAVYDLNLAPGDALNSAQQRQWTDTLEEHSERLRLDAEQAHVRGIPKPGVCERMSELTQNFRAEDAPELHQAHQALTRLGSPSVSLICLYDTPNGTAIDALGKEVIDMNETPTIAQARRLLRRSVTVSAIGVAAQLLTTEPHKAWQRSSLLRRHRLALFDEHRRASLCKVGLRLDPDLGLVIEGKEDE